jgi:transposase-like protein
MEELVELLGITSLSKSQVSRMAVELDGHVADLRGRPLRRPRAAELDPDISRSNPT